MGHDQSTRERDLVVRSLVARVCKTIGSAWLQANEHYRIHVVINAERAKENRAIMRQVVSDLERSRLCLRK